MTKEYHWIDVGGCRSWYVRKNRKKKKEREMTSDCPRCGLPVFVKLDKHEWKDPRYPIYECQSCSYFEERFE